MAKKRKTHYSGARLRKLRKRMGMTMLEFALQKELQVDPSTVSYWESERFHPPQSAVTFFLKLESDFPIDIRNAGV